MMKKLMLILSCLFFSVGLIYSQTIQVSGVVVDDTGIEVVGASVVVKGSTTGVATDIDGKFSLNVPENSTLVFSLVGMKKVEKKATSNMKVVMDNDEALLKEVVVTALGIKRQERSLGYSVSTISADETIQKAEPDMLRALDGKVPGVVISATSGSAGSATRVTIRGNSSFFGNNQPLYIVDGVPYSNNETATSNQASSAGGSYASGISTLDPNDIESMNVLKGASAAALYGSRAANGVILITTKSGSASASRAGKGLEVTLNTSYTIESVTGLPDYQNSYGAGSDFKASAANGSWGASFADVQHIPLSAYAAGDYAKFYPELGYYLDSDPNGILMTAYKAQKNNVKNLFDTGGIYDVSANIRSTNEKGGFSATLSKLGQDSYIPNADFNRYSVSVGGNQKLMNGLTVGGNVSFSRAKQNGPMFGNNQSSGIGASSFGRALILARSWDMSFPSETPDGRSLLFVGSQADNPLWSWKYNKITSIMDRTIANFNVGYDLTDHLSVQYVIGINDYKMSRKEVLNIGSRAVGGNGRIVDDEYKSQEIESNLVLGYENTFFDDFTLSAHLGHNGNQMTTNRSKVTGMSMIVKGVYNIDNTRSQVGAAETMKRRLWALYGDLSIGYKNYAFMTVTGRNDFSSTLPKGNRSFFYPSVTGSFVFTDAFKISNSILNFGKVRLGWAKVGLDASPYYMSGYYNFEDVYAGQATLSKDSYLYDPKLKPEFTTEFEVGTDLQLFDGRLNIDFTYYNRNSTDQIAYVSLPGSSGYRRYYTNFGKMNNRGLEIGVNVTPVSTNDFKWDMYWMYTRNENEIKELTDGLTRVDLATGFISPASVLEVGKAYGALYGSAYARDDEGNLLIDPASGFYIPSIEQKYLGNPAPKYKTSLTNTLTYKGVSFSFMLDAQVGGCVYTTYISDLMGRGVTRDTEDRLGSRILPGVYGDRNTMKPILDGNGNKIQNTVQLQSQDMWFSPNSSISSFATNGVDEASVYDATTIRLREISLGYDIPKKWLAKTPIGTLNVSFVARNLWFFAPNVPKHSNYDPTVASSYGAGNIQGIDYTTAPNTRRFAFNLRATL